VDRIACLRKLSATTADAFLAAFDFVMSRFAAAEANPAALTPEMLAPNIELLIITAELLHTAIKQLPHATVRVNNSQKVMADEAAQEQTDRAAATPESPHDEEAPRGGDGE
jgi:hypothetical protein